MTGVVNAVYNEADMILVVLDNSTTAMTGHQPHPGTGHRMMELAPGYIKKTDIANRVSIEKVLEGIGVKAVEILDPMDLKSSVAAVKKLADMSGVRAIIFRSPCAVIIKPDKPFAVDKASCIGCKKCINSIGCPAITFEDGKPHIDSAVCTGCSLCSQVCPVSAIKGAASHE